MCQNLNPCGDFYDMCPDTSTPEPESVHVVVPFLIILAGMIVLFFSCQVFLMIRNGKCPCRQHKGYSSELVSDLYGIMVTFDDFFLTV